MGAKGHRAIPWQFEWLKGNVIGSGSFSTVHLAIDSASGALFVAKSARSEAGIMSLKNEANILENLDSPHIVKCMGKDESCAENGDKIYSLLFEYMGGGSLSNVADNFGGTLNEKLIRLYTREILRGLKYLQENGIVHCDVKCKNVLLDTSGAVKLADLGCARRLSDRKAAESSQSCDGGIGGTPLWMAPEVLRNEGLDFAADIWSLGCTVIEMATGRPPWGGEETNPVVAMLKIAKGNTVPEFPRHFSAEGLDFLSKCLQRDPGKRWTSERLLSHPFVAGNATCERIRKEDATSPTSVLDAASYDLDDDDDDDELVHRRLPFSAKFCLLDKKFLPNRASENHFESSHNWIMVRSNNAKE